MNIRLDHKRALVTGGNSGIGKAIALGLADAGAKVAINYVTRPEAAELLVHQIKDRHGEAIALQADVSDPEAIAQMFGHINDAWGGIDILINNAGSDGNRVFGWEADIAAWRKVIEVNLFGAFYCAREALKCMVQRFNHKLRSMPSGKILRIETLAPAVIHWTADDWNTVQDVTAHEVGLGIYLADLMTNTLAEGEQVKFTLYWPDAGHWEVADFVVTLTSSEAGS